MENPIILHQIYITLVYLINISESWIFDAWKQGFLGL